MTRQRPKAALRLPVRDAEPVVSYYLVPLAETDDTMAHLDVGFIEAVRTDRWAVCSTEKSAPLVAALWDEAQDRERQAAGKGRASLQAKADRALADLAREREWGDVLAGIALGYATNAPQDSKAAEDAEGDPVSGEENEAAFRLGVMYLLSAIDRGHEPRVGAALLRPKVAEALRLGFQRRDELDLGG